MTNFFQEEPFVQKKKGTDVSGAPLVDGKYLEVFTFQISSLSFIK
jgi:hypothetical protein